MSISDLHKNKTGVFSPQGFKNTDRYDVPRSVRKEGYPVWVVRHVPNA